MTDSSAELQDLCCPSLFLSCLASLPIFQEGTEVSRFHGYEPITLIAAGRCLDNKRPSATFLRSPEGVILRARAVDWFEPVKDAVLPAK